MIGKASLAEELFIVLIPGRDILLKATNIQKKIANKYNLNNINFFPEIHMTIDRIKKDCVDEAWKIIRDTVKNYNSIEIQTGGFVCFSSKRDKYLVLKAVKTDSLLSLSNSIHKGLAKRGFSTINNYSEWFFHITIVTSLFAEKLIPDKFFSDLCKEFEGKLENNLSYAKAIELWQPTPKRDKRIIKGISF